MNEKPEKPSSLELEIFVHVGDVGAKLEKLLQPGNGALVNGEFTRYSVFECGNNEKQNMAGQFKLLVEWNAEGLQRSVELVQ
jgi:hypothetical protein